MHQENGTIVLFPFMAQGHIIPFLSLALNLEKKNGYAISLINTHQNINKIQTQLPKSSNIRLIEIPFDSTEHGLPPNCESTESLPLLLQLRLIESSPSLKPAFRNLISDALTAEEYPPPVCIISDMFFAWSAHVAHEFGLVHAIFNAGSGYGMAGFHTAWRNLPHLKSNSDEFQLPGFPAGFTFKSKNMPEHLTAQWDFAMETFEDWKETDAMLFNTVEDMDRVGLEYFREHFPNCSVHAIGPIISSIGSKAGIGEEAEAITKHLMNWIDSMPQRSVLYVAFGSQYSPSETQMLELAKALDSSGVNFLWAVKPPAKLAGGGLPENMNGAKNDWPFPVGFEERISGRGLLLKKWVPQMEILSHESIGGFLSHCGWNSVIESLSNGVPILGWPLMAEQPFNAALLEEEVGVCVVVANGMMSEVKHEEVAEKIEVVMHGVEGELMRRKACKVMRIIENATSDDHQEEYKGSSVKALDDFLNLILKKKDNDYEDLAES